MLTKSHQSKKNPALEAHIRATLDEIKSEVHGTAISKAKTSKLLFAEEFRNLFQMYHIKLQSLIEHIAKELDSEIVRHRVFESQGATNDLIRDLALKRDELLGQFSHTINQLKYVQVPAKLKSRIWAYIGVIALSFYDGMFCVGAFEGMGISYIGAILMAISFSVALIFYVHIFPRIIGLMRTSAQRRFMTGLLFIITLAVFYYLGILRANHLNKEICCGDPLFTPWTFTLISFLIFNISLGISYFFLPNKEEKEEIRRYKTLVKENKTLALEVASVESEIRNTERNQANIKNEGVETFAYGQNLEQEVINSAERFYLDFKNTYQKHRDSEEVPGWISMEYPFSFNRRFSPKNS